MNFEPTKQLSLWLQKRPKDYAEIAPLLKDKQNKLRAMAFNLMNVED